jgi:topoisomerase-4 subunit A
VSEDQKSLFGDDSPELASGGESVGGGGHLKQLLDENFIQYASYVIRDRAIPDLVVGLKPVQRRILYSLKENDDGKFVKVANIVGHTMQYHPHGDASIGDALVALTRKGFLIEGQGNFGNLLTGDPAAASRYIECRLTDLARENLFHEELTKFVPSYDGRRKEPVSLPAKLPLLLMMGAEGIAVGLSTRILSHNFIELLQAQVAILDKKEFQLFPDFQQGGLMDASEYAKGVGRVRLRSDIDVTGPRQLTIRSVSPSVTTDSLIASIEAATKKKNLKVKAINDYTAGTVEIELTLGQEQDAEKMKQTLYAFTSCEVTLSSRVVLIDRDRPVEMDVDGVLRANTKNLLKTLKRELEAERRGLLEKLHHMTLVQIFVEHRIYKRIEECKTYPDVQAAVLDGVNKHRELLRRDVTGNDVEMLLGVKIKRISRYDMNKHRKGIEDILAGLKAAEGHLADLTGYTRRYLKALIRKYGKAFPRRTEITSFDQIEVRDLTANELTLCYDRVKGYVGHGVEGDELFLCSSLDKLVIVRGDGTYRVVNPPERLFVDTDMAYCAPADRDRTCLMVYCDEDGFSHVKRFTFGGSILNKEYSCIPDRGKILYFTDCPPKTLYVKYKKRKGQRIHQQSFDLSKIVAKGVKTRGKHMTSKKVDSIQAVKPRGWVDKRPGRSGAFLEL